MKMSNIAKLRDAADFLLDQGKYEEAYHIYDEIYNQMWGALGSVHLGLSNFSSIYLNNNLKSSIEFKNAFTINAANTIFLNGLISISIRR